MSIVDSIKNMLGRRGAESQLDPGLSLGIPDASGDPSATMQMGGGIDSMVQPGPISELEPSGAAKAGQITPEALHVDSVDLPVLGRRGVSEHQRILFMLLAVALIGLAVVAVYTRARGNVLQRQLAVVGNTLMQSQRLAKTVSQALMGGTQAFPEVADSAGVISKSVRGLKSGDSQLELEALPDREQPVVDKILPLMQRSEKNAATVMAQQKTLTQVSAALRQVNRQSSDLQEIADAIANLKLQQGAPAAEIAAAGQVVMLTQRIGKSANEFLTVEGVSPEAVFLLGKDLNLFKEVATGLLEGSSELHVGATKDSQTKQQLEALLKLFEDTRAQTGVILGNLQPLVAAREAQGAIVNDSEPLRKNLEELQNLLVAQTGLGWLALTLLFLFSLVALVSAGGLLYVQLLDSRRRQMLAEVQRVEAERQQQEARRINDANQAAILRLMNELQTVAEGDLTQEATVTEDITGAIADSVNYTVEELRSLVGHVQKTATQVVQTTTEVDANSTELLAASNEQLHEIRETGRSVLDMAGRINEVSSQAQESALVARQSLQAADQGLKAVQDTIGGMNAIRDQIQETSKRIKRLGESSQEIGEITELISDITEQTNVLALNAAIQAASAGEAGRGFSVVAEEVQRLAERSADATRQIAALVKTIQTDTQDAVGAMERSTQGVVEGAKLSDNAGAALSEIDRVSRRLAELIEQISGESAREAKLANEVADNIQHIFAVTEQTGEGTRSTAAQVRELSKMAEELRTSVSRFRIA